MEINPNLPPGFQAKYLKSRLNELSHLRSGGPSLDLRVLKTVVHKIRGNAATFGLPSLGQIAGEIEDTLTMQPSSDPKPLLVRLERELESLARQQEL